MTLGRCPLSEVEVDYMLKVDRLLKTPLASGEVLYLTQSVFKLVLQMSTPPQIRPYILYYYLYKE